MAGEILLFMHRRARMIALGTVVAMVASVAHGLHAI